MSHSLSNLLPFLLLHSKHAVTRLVQPLSPPLHLGWTWSIVKFFTFFVWRPQYWQVWLSRLKIFLRVGRTSSSGNSWKRTRTMAAGISTSPVTVLIVWVFLYGVCGFVAFPESKSLTAFFHDIIFSICSHELSSNTSLFMYILPLVLTIHTNVFALVLIPCVGRHELL